MTGATGFLGSNLLKKLLEQGYEISILKRSTSNTNRIDSVINRVRCFDMDKESIDYCLSQIKPSTVIHCATDYGRKNTEPSLIIEANLILPLKLLELCSVHNVNCFINTDTYLDKGINYYSLSKKQFKEWLTTYSNDLICINVILEHFYGPNDDKTKFVSYVFEQIKNKASGLDFTLGEQKRDFTFIDDVIDAFLLIILSSKQMQKGKYDFGIGTNQQIKIKDLVMLISKLSNNTATRLNFGAIPYRKNEIMNSNIDTSKIRELGWKPRYSIEQGLKAMIEAEFKTAF